MYLIRVAAARITLILLCAQLRADLCRPCSELGRKGVAGRDGIGGHCALYANSQHQPQSANQNSTGEDNLDESSG